MKTAESMPSVNDPELENDETFDLIAADKVEGTSVYDASGEKIGTVDDVMIDKISGKVAYAVVSYGGFLGMGKDHYPLPWGVLDYDTEKGGYVVGLDRDLLKKGPTEESAQWSDPAWNRRLHDYYGVAPYWM